MLRTLLVLSALSLSCSQDRSLPVAPAGKIVENPNSLSDREALESFYTHLTRGMGVSRLDYLTRKNWMTRSTIAKWEGVTLNEDGRVIEFNLNGSEIWREVKGWFKIPKEAFAALAELDQLKVLDIQNLYLMIDPSDLGKLRNLEYLDLYKNFFIEGASYSSVCQLSKLTFLSNMIADDSLLECIGSLSQLEHLKIRSNYFEFRGEWVWEWTRPDVCEPCSRFRRGSFVDSLSPAPDSLLLSNLKELQNLKRLALSDMGLRAIPPWIGDLQNLEYLSFGGITPFGGNPLIGPIPPEIANLRNLKSLSFIASGSLPAEIGQMENLEYIRIYGPYTYNKDGATGSYYGKYTEEEIEALPGLEGTLPTEWGNLTSLRILYLQGYISGNLPPEWGGMQSLETLFLGDMELSGSIPEEWCQMTSLKELYLENNLLSGPIPEGIGNLTNLETLNLSNNRISGPLPKQITELKKLVSLYLSNNELTGPLINFSRMSYLESIGLGENQLSGEIEGQLFPSSTRSLGLRDNNFSGTPGGFPNLRHLVNLQSLGIDTFIYSPVFGPEICSQLPQSFRNTSSSQQYGCA